jgi:hypothetical protein
LVIGHSRFAAYEPTQITGGESIFTRLCHFFHLDTTMRFGLEASFPSSIRKLNKKPASAGYNTPAIL